MPKYEIDIETRALLGATILVEAKDEREAKKIGAARMREGGYSWEIIEEDNKPRKLVEVTEVREPKPRKPRKPGSIFTPKPPKNFCANCGLNEIFHPSKPHGDQTACETFTPPAWVKRAPA